VKGLWRGRPGEAADTGPPSNLLGVAPVVAAEQARIQRVVHILDLAHHFVVDVLSPETPE
jgi:hypothetical protein